MVGQGNIVTKYAVKNRTAQIASGDVTVITVPLVIDLTVLVTVRLGIVVQRAIACASKVTTAKIAHKSVNVKMAAVVIT